MFNRLFAVAALGLMAACSAPVPAVAQVAEPVAGTDYVELPAPAPTSSPGKIEVLEVFGYWCIHCAHLDPSLEKWKKTIPADVAFSYVPAIFSDGGVDEVFARAFYTAETMGVLDKTHSAMFTAAAVERRIQSPDAILDFYAEKGVDRGNFEATMSSFAVNAKVARTKQSLPRYAIDGTPAMIVNGKYRVLNRQDGGWERTLQIVDFLVAKERAAAGKS